MLPLHKLVADQQVADLKVETQVPACASHLTDRPRDLFQDSVDRCDICEAYRGDRRKRKGHDLIPEQIIDLCPVQFVEASDGLVAGLIKSDLPLHLIEIVIIHDNEDRAHAKLHGSSVTLIVSKAFVERVPALICLSDGAKNREVGDLDGFLLLLDHIAKALCDTTPDHVEKSDGLPLIDLE